MYSHNPYNKKSYPKVKSNICPRNRETKNLVSLQIMEKILIFYVCCLYKVPSKKSKFSTSYLLCTHHGKKREHFKNFRRFLHFCSYFSIVLFEKNFLYKAFRKKRFTITLTCKVLFHYHWLQYYSPPNLSKI